MDEGRTSVPPTLSERPSRSGPGEGAEETLHVAPDVAGPSGTGERTELGGDPQARPATKEEKST